MCLTPIQTSYKIEFLMKNKAICGSTSIHTPLKQKELQGDKLFSIIPLLMLDNLCPLQQSITLHSFQPLAIPQSSNLSLFTKFPFV